jgi:P27 family predicted phage terminase small subunit
MAGKKGRSGRRPKSTASLKLKGTYRADRHGARPDPRTEIPDPPNCLYGIALEEWFRVTPLLAEIKMISGLDLAVVAAYCLEWSTYTKANGKLRLSRSYLATSTKGTKMRHPLLSVRDKALANMLKLCVEMGLTPASRSRLNVEAAAVAPDPLTELIKQQQERRLKRTTGQPAG